MAEKVSFLHELKVIFFWKSRMRSMRDFYKIFLPKRVKKRLDVSTRVVLSVSPTFKNEFYDKIWKLFLARENFFFLSNAHWLIFSKSVFIRSKMSYDVMSIFRKMRKSANQFSGIPPTYRNSFSETMGIKLLIQNF